MKICFRGTSHAALTLKEGARRRGFEITDAWKTADLVFISEDTPTDEDGNRDLNPIGHLIADTQGTLGPIVLTSQVPPGFTRSLNRSLIYHQAETLRIEDGIQRAMFPELFIVGCDDTKLPILVEYQEYLQSFDCPIVQMTYEEAEFAKIAINAFLISQVETSNMLSERAALVGADWGKVCQALRHDSRIGKYAYLTPGEPLNSKHLLRDFVTLKEIKASRLLDAWERLPASVYRSFNESL